MLFWGIFALALFILDALTASALLLGFSIASLVTSLLSLAIPLWGQIIAFIILGTVLSFYIVPSVKKVPEIKSYGDSLEGVIIKASCDMKPNEIYQEKVKGIFWNIKCEEDVNANQLIKIIKIDKENNCLIVKGE